MAMVASFAALTAMMEYLVGLIKGRFLSFNKKASSKSAESNRAPSKHNKQESIILYDRSKYKKEMRQ